LRIRILTPNRYIPPDYDPKKHSTLNAHQGKKHALGKRAAKIDQGILVTRFELPFNIWCGTCNVSGSGESTSE
jgi:coiled-coil domain-containing protein 130